MKRAKRIVYLIMVIVTGVFTTGCGKTEGQNLEYLLGFICGILCGLVLIRFMAWLVSKLGGRIQTRCRKDSYDERQLLARGQAYKTAFFTLLFYTLAVSLLDDIFGISIFMSFCGIWIGIALSIMVFAVTCILKDAYMSLYENARGIIMVFSIVGILNIAVGIRTILERRPLLENGAVSVEWTNLVVGILFLVILIVFCGKVIYNKKQFEEEAEDEESRL